MASDTFVNYISRIRRYLHETDSTTSFWSDTFLKEVFNSTYRMRCAELVMAHEGYFTLIATTNVIADQSMYLFPPGFERLLKLELTRSDGRTVPLQRYERHQKINNSPQVGGDSYLPDYRPIGEGFVLEPAPTTGGANITVLQDFDTDPTTDITYTAGTDTVLSQDIVNFREGSASIIMDKTGTTGAFGTFQRTSQIIDMSKSNPYKIAVYIPSLTDLSSFAITLGTGGLADSTVYQFLPSSLAIGWNDLTILSGSPSVIGAGVTLSNITDYQIGFTWVNVNARLGFRVDNWREEIPGTVASVLRMEYHGVPTALAADSDQLHADFPVSFEELLVLDTVVTAFDAEALLENGMVRSIQRQQGSWESRWERYIDSRFIARQRVEPFTGWYENA